MIKLGDVILSISYNVAFWQQQQTKNSVKNQLPFKPKSKIWHANLNAKNWKDFAMESIWHFISETINLINNRKLQFLYT